MSVLVLALLNLLPNLLLPVLMAGSVLGGSVPSGPVAHRADQAERHQADARGDHVRLQARLDIPQDDVAEEGDPQNPGPGEQEQSCLEGALHSSHHPVSALHATAVIAVAVEKRTAKARPKVPT